MLQLMPGRGIPVSVEAEQGQPGGNSARDRILDFALDEMHFVFGVTGTEHIRTDVLQTCMAPDARAGCVVSEQSLRSHASEIPVALGRCGHPLVSIVKVK